jgi:hypothetical protein
MDIESIKKALDHFENDEFVNAKEILKKEIHSHRNEWLKDKLELKNDIEPKSGE